MSMIFRQPGANEVARLIEAFRAQPVPSVVAKLDILLQLARMVEPSIVAFLMDGAIDSLIPAQGD